VVVLRAVEGEIPYGTPHRQRLEVSLPRLAEGITRRLVIGLQDQAGNLQAGAAHLAEDGPVKVDGGDTACVMRTGFERRAASQRVADIGDVTEVQRAECRRGLGERRNDEGCV